MLTSFLAISLEQITDWIFGKYCTLSLTKFSTIILKVKYWLSFEQIFSLAKNRKQTCFLQLHFWVKHWLNFTLYSASNSLIDIKRCFWKLVTDKVLGRIFNGWLLHEFWLIFFEGNPWPSFTQYFWDYSLTKFWEIFLKINNWPISTQYCWRLFTDRIFGKNFGSQILSSYYTIIWRCITD